MVSILHHSAFEFRTTKCVKIILKNQKNIEIAYGVQTSAKPPYWMFYIVLYNAQQLNTEISQPYWLHSKFERRYSAMTDDPT